MITRRKLLKGLLGGVIALPLSLAGKDKDEPEVIHADIVADTVFNRPVIIVSENATMMNSIVHGPVTVECNEWVMTGNFVQVKPDETGVTIGGDWRS